MIQLDIQVAGSMLPQEVSRAPASISKLDTKENIPWLCAAAHTRRAHVRTCLVASPVVAQPRIRGQQMWQRQLTNAILICAGWAALRDWHTRSWIAAMCYASAKIRASHFCH